MLRTLRKYTTAFLSAAFLLLVAIYLESPTSTMSHPSRVAIVTGANKGIGLAIVRQLALQYPASSFNSGPLLIYLTARDKSRGEAALKEIQNDSHLARAKALTIHGGLAEVTYHALDIGDPNSISVFADYVEKTHPEGIDSLINNAGVAMNGFDINVVKSTLGVNYYGTLEMCQKFLPMIKDGGRLVNVASTAGRLGTKYAEPIKRRFLGAETIGDVTKLMEDFTKAVEGGRYKEEGWPGAAYALSKAGEIGMTRMLAREMERKGGKVPINVCCPGWVKTDMTKGSGHMTVDEGAMTPVLLGIGDVGGKSGEFWQHEKVIQW